MKTRKLTLALLPLLAAGMVQAQEFYAGGGLGIVQVKDSDSFVEQGLTVETKIQDKTFGWRVFGGVDLNDNFAIEAAYVESQTAKDDARIFINGDLVGTVPIRTDVSATTLSLIGLVRLNDQIRLFAKVGYFDGEQTASTPGGLTLAGGEVISTPGSTVKDDADGTTAGFGARARISDNFAVRVDYDWFDTDIDTVQSFGFSLQYLFGK